MKILCVPVGPLQANCYLVSDEQGRAFAIDPGGEADRLVKTAEERSLTISHILLTHGHVDHLAGAADLARLTGAVIGCAAETAPLVRRPESMMAIPGFQNLSGAEPDLILADGDSVDVGEIHVDVITTPGHSPGDVTYHAEGHLFCGDLLFYRSVGRTDFPGGDFGTLLSSVQKLADRFPASTVVLPGHMQATTLGAELQLNPFLGGMTGRG